MSLYQSHRPATLDEVIGNESIHGEDEVEAQWLNHTQIVPLAPFKTTALVP